MHRRLAVLLLCALVVGVTGLVAGGCGRRTAGLETLPVAGGLPAGSQAGPGAGPGTPPVVDRTASAATETSTETAGRGPSESEETAAVDPSEPDATATGFADVERTLDELEAVLAEIGE